MEAGGVNGGVFPHATYASPRSDPRRQLFFFVEKDFAIQ